MSSRLFLTPRNTLVAILVLALLPAAAPAQAERESGEDEAWDVTLARGETRDVAFTTREGTWMSVDLSPDGEWIVFDLLGDVYRLPAGGGTAELLTRDAGVSVNYHPRYSPDGATIAFVSDREGQNNLWLMDADGSNPRAVFTNPMVRAVEPVWTPDGDYIIVRRQKIGQAGSPGGSGIWMYHREGGQGVELVGSEHSAAAWPSVSRDGRYLYFHEYEGPPGLAGRDALKGHWQLRRKDLETGEVVEVTTGEAQQQIRTSSGGAYAPEVSPDGRWLAFARRIPDGTISYKGHRYGPRTALWLRDLETGAERVVMDPISVDNAEGIKTLRILPGYDWADDGRSIVISQGGKIRRLELASGEVETVPFEARVERTLSEQARAELRITDGPFRARFLRWYGASPDGATATFQAVGRIWRMALPDGEPERVTGDDFEPFEFAPAWSPDGSRIAFTSWDDEAGGHLWTVPADGGEPRRLTETAAEYVNPVWSPDGTAIVLARGTGAPMRGRGIVHNPYWELVAVPADGGAAQKVATVAAPSAGFFAGARTQVVRASFGPKGRIYYPIPMQEDGNGQTVTGLVSVRGDGSDERVHATFRFADEAVVSPDGRWVAFQEGDNVYAAPLPPGGTGGEPLAIDKKNGTVPIRTLSTEGGLYPTWRDEGTVTFGSGPFFYSHDIAAESTDTAEIELAVPRRIPGGTVALTNARIITLAAPTLGPGATGTAADNVIDGGTVLVEGARIACVGDCDTGAADRVIDLGGATVIPGFVDMHAHHYREHRGIIPRHNFESAVYLAYGVTANLDNSMWSQNVFSTAELIRAGEVLGPRTWSTGDPLYRGDGSRQNEITSYEVAEQNVNRLHQWGATAVKQYLQPRRDQRQWVTDAARRNGMMVTSEGSDLPYVMGMLMDGHTGFEHPLSYVPLYDDAARFLGEGGVVYSPTFVVGGPGPWNEEFFFADSDVWRQPKQQAFMPWRQVVPHMRRRMLRPDTDYSYPMIAQGMADVIAHGGTGAIGSHGQAHGIASHWEVWMAAEGVGALGALEVASLHGARFLGAERDLGSLEPGKLADLVVLNSDPLDDIRNTTDIRYVMQGGVLFDGATLDERWPEQRPYGTRWWVDPAALRTDDRPVDWHERH